MTVVLRLLRDIADHLEVETPVTRAQIQDLGKRTDIRTLTRRMDELAEEDLAGKPPR